MSGDADAALPGRVTITRRALGATLEAVAAERLGVRHRDVTVDLADDAARLAVDVRGPARTAPGEPTLRELSDAVRAAILDDGRRLTGAEISRVAVRITGWSEQARRTR